MSTEQASVFPPIERLTRRSFGPPPSSLPTWILGALTAMTVLGILVELACG